MESIKFKSFSAGWPFNACVGFNSWNITNLVLSNKPTENLDFDFTVTGTANMPLKFAVVCSSNQNRSMEAHNFMSKRGLTVKSFGSGQQVKLPGPSLDKPNIYTFDTPYEHMYKDLITKDQNLYTQNGVLHLLDRNRRIKEKPERFQDCRDRFDIVFTVEERILIKY